MSAAAAHRGGGSAPSTGAAPSVSVIVPVYNDAARLARCLAALELQTYPADRYEVIVVDNGSDVPITPSIGEFPHARIEREPRPGVAAARIAGIERARGEILAFTDADCVPDPGWIAGGVRCLLETPNCGLVGGRIEVFTEDGETPTIAGVLSMATHLRQERFVRSAHWAAGANLFTSRRVVDGIAPMNADLILCEEVEWGLRVHAAGYRLAYAPDALVRHPARSSFRQHCRRAIRHEFAYKQLREIAGIGMGARFWVGQHLVWPVRDTYQYVIRSPLLAPFEKAQAAAMSSVLIVLRILVNFTMRLGATFDVRERWG